MDSFVELWNHYRRNDGAEIVKIKLIGVLYVKG